MRSHYLLYIAAGVGIFLCGCNGPRGNLQTFNRYYVSGDNARAAQFAECKLGKKENPAGEDLLWALQLGSIERVDANYAASTQYFDRCEDMLKFFDERGEIGDAVCSVAVNDNIIPYKGEEYDGVMVNVYKALNFMAEGNGEYARVEFNRALDRQRRAKENYNEEIAELQDELDKKKAKSVFYQQNVDNPDIAAKIEEKYSNLSAFEAYPDFVNPFATYMAGVFFACEGDWGKAVDLFKESYGMVGENQYIAEDLLAVENRLGGKGDRGGTVWVIFENGLGPVKEEWRIDIPLFVATNNIKYIGIALPYLAFRDGAWPYLTAEADGRSYCTSVVCNMDRVVQTEFNKDFKSILTRAIISATTKAIAQYAMENQNNSGSSLASSLMALYSFATTAADVRIWTALPKDIQIARLPMPEDGVVRISPPAGGAGVEVCVAKWKNVVIYVKYVTRQSVPRFEIIGYK